MITVRDEQLGDAEAVQQVEAAATATLRQTYRPNRKAIENRSRISHDLKRVVGIVDARLVGTTQYYVDGDSLRIIGLGVLPEFRRQGVARALVSSLADSARTLGLRGLVTRTVKETGNVGVFENLGFHVISESPDEYSESDRHATLTDVELRMDL